jgi:hypothetical protein
MVGAEDEADVVRETGDEAVKSVVVAHRHPLGYQITLGWEPSTKAQMTILRI